MTSIIKTIFWSCFFLLVYTYAFYPILLIILSKFKIKKQTFDDHYFPKVAMIIAAYNEEKVITQKLENSLLIDYPRDQIQIIVASDGSNDQTNIITSEYAEKGIILYNYQDRRGKVNVLNSSVSKVDAEIIVFSDANTMYAPDAVKKMVRHFADPNIGSVCGALDFVSAQDSSTGKLESVYWRYEMLLKRLESQHGSLLGANGGIYALRKDLYFAPPPNTIVEDFVIPMKILEKGFKVIYEPLASATEEAAQHIVHEKKRRVRIGAGDFQALCMLGHMLNPLRGFPALAFWSHKVLRWIAPFLMIDAFWSNIIFLREPLYLMFFLGQCGFYFCAFTGQILNWSGKQIKFFNLCYYFVSMNFALLLGFFMFVSGKQRVTWERTER